MADELAVEDFPRNIHQLEDHGVAHSIVDRGAFFARVNQVATSQTSKLLRNGRLIGFQQRLQFIHALFTTTQMFQNCQARRVSEGLKEVGFKGVKRLIQEQTLSCIHVYNLIFKYKHICPPDKIGDAPNDHNRG